MPSVFTPVDYSTITDSTFKESVICPNAAYFGPPIPYTVSTVLQSSAKGNEASGVKNPNWKKQVMAKANATTGYMKTVAYYRGGSVSGSTKYTYRRWGCDFNFDGKFSQRGSYYDPFTYVSDGQDSELYDQCIAGLKRKISSHSNQTNVLIPIAEITDLRKTLTSVTNSASGLVTALLEIKRTKGKSAADYASEKWLTWSFGIAPTISEINSICASVHSYMTGRKHNVVFKSSVRKQWFETHEMGNVGLAYGLNQRHNIRHANKLSYQLIAGLNVDIQSGNNYGLGPQFGLDFGSIVPAVWELTPYSWVVDYFTTAGDYFEDTFVAEPQGVIYVVSNSKYECDVVIDAEPVSVGPDYIYSFSQTPVKAYYMKFTRANLGLSLPSRSLRFKSADEIGRNGVTRLLNLTSLLVLKSK